MAKYKTVGELAAAYKAGEISEPVYLDNDDTHVYLDSGVKVFDMHPQDLLEGALTALGIPFEHV